MCRRPGRGTIQLPVIDNNMSCKNIDIVVVMALAALACASTMPQYGGHYEPKVHYEEDYYAYPKYKYEYGVHDEHTHDIHSQKEERDGDVVHGVYQLVEADGTKRVVEYSADHKTGFNAVVHREHNVHPQHYAKPKYEKYEPKY